MMWKVLPPFIIAVGVIGNALSLAAFTHRKYRRSSSTTLYLLTLAISDTVFLLNVPVRQWLRMVWNWDLRDTHGAVCKTSAFLAYFTFHFTVWLLVVLTMEQMLSVISPHLVRNKCTRSVAKFNIAAIFAAVFALTAHFLYGIPLKDAVVAKQLSLCEFINDDYKYFFQNV